MQLPFLFALLFTTLVAAQNVFIYAPPPFSGFFPGDSFVVDIDRPNSLTGSRDVSVAIGLLNCAERSNGAATCDDINPAWMMGTILYAGPYQPKSPTGSTNIYENFTVTVPNDFKSGAAILSVAHFALVGELFWPMLEVVNQSVYIY